MIDERETKAVGKRGIRLEEGEKDKLIGNARGICPESDGRVVC